MIELNGKYNTAKVFTDNVEQTAISQIIELCSQEFVKDSKIRIMSDTHAGAGCTIGTTMTIQDKIVPNLVGVDIGCVDKDTEFLSTNGWVKISEYGGQEIAIYDNTNNITKFENPLLFIKQEEKEFFHLKTKYGIDQMLSKEHNCLVETGSHHRPNARGKKYCIKAEELYNKHCNTKLGFRDNFICEIPNIKLENKLNMTNEEIRIQVMIMADGNFSNESTNRCVCHFNKERKINRCKELLNNANIDYKINVNKDKTTTIIFYPSKKYKRISYFWSANLEQLSIICDEIKNWDYSVEQGAYISVYKEDADFVQYAFSTQGIRTFISKDNRENKVSYRCLISANRPRVQLAGVPKTPINIVPSKDGYKYCFTTTTGFWIMRRNGCIAVTGNCGMYTIKLKEKEIDFQKLDDTIRKYVPSGQNIRETEHKLVNSLNLKELKCFKYINNDRALKSVGTLGGGNHFIEVDKDEEDNLYLVIHSGSRYLGKQVAEHYQELGYKKLTENRGSREKLINKLKAEGRGKDIKSELAKVPTTKINKQLAYIEGQDLINYLNDMKITQYYAELNRISMANEILKNMNLHEVESFTTIHNYIDVETKILRKGAISANKDEKVIIPINMRDGSLICIGKGNEDWNNSAPHGAGRILSRSKANEKVTLEEFKDSMKDIWTTSVCQSTVDESPMAYKPMQEIIDNIQDTVEIVNIIKPLYNFKANS